jgi:CrcB protein
VEFGNIRREINLLPVDPDVDAPPTPHPWTLVRANADLLPFIAVGGALGSLARWGLGKALPHTPHAFATSTLVINIAGSLLLGILMALVLEVWSETRYLRPFVGTGIIGGFTTFSTFALDARYEAVDSFPVATGYVLGSVAGGILAVLLGLVATRALIDRRRA